VRSSEALAELLIIQWIKIYKKSPRVTAIVTLIVSVAIVATVVIVGKQNQEALEVKRLQNLNYAKQVQSLDETRASLNALIEFVDNEKRQIELSQQALRSIKSEHERLKPLVETDRKVIESIFATQEARNQAAQGAERWIGFGLGVVASLIASFLWAGISYALQQARDDST
jgi:sensor c-di-GMP phosphodiesterase-like protein